jgi:p-hydroxybenzoate 3-monooxygenase
VQRLITTLLGAGGDVRFDAADVAVHEVDGARPRVTYRDGDGAEHTIECAYIAGCDGYYGPSRAGVPTGVLHEYAYDHGIGWLTVLTDSSAPRHPLMAVSDHGFAAQFARGPHASRFYLQCPPTDDPAAWPEDRVWEQLRLRLADPELPAAPVVEKRVVEMRSSVFEPMCYGRLFLVGDAAHVVVPMGGKGMNMALYDAGVLARALRAAVHDGDGRLLGEYSATCLRRVWAYQEFARWMTEMVHDAGDESVAGPFRRQLARARLEAVLTVPAMTRMFAEYQIGVA